MSLLTSATDVAIEEDLKQFLIVLLVAVSAASLPKIFAPLRQVPYTLLLLVVGLGLALVDVRLLHLSPGMILMIFLPPLLFEAAWNMRWSDLRAEFLPSSLYAVGGVIISIAIVASRALTIYGFTALTNWLAHTNISWQDRTVLWWTGLRGSVSIALAISLPLTIGGRDEIIANSFGVVWFTLLVQGLTTKPLLEKLNLLEDRSLHQQYLELIARRDALQQVFAHLNQDKPLTIDPEVHRSHQTFVREKLQQLEVDITHLRESHPCLQAFSLEQHQAELLAIEVNTYKNFVRDGLLKQPLNPTIQKVF